MKIFGATGIIPEPGKPEGYDETGSVSSAIPGIETTAKSSNWSNHTYGMLEDATTDVGHSGFMVDAETEAAILYDFATHPELRSAVKTEFTRIQELFAEYQKDLQKAYPQPVVPQPKQ